MIYAVKLMKDESGYTVCVPGLPGCWSEGDTEAEALLNIKDAIKEYLELARELAEGEELRLVEVG